MTDFDFDVATQTEHSEKLIAAKLRALTANLIRIVRGGGKLYEVEGQVLELAREFERHRELTSSGISQHVFDQALNIRSQLERRDHPDRERQAAEASMVKGALQYAASTLLSQNTHGSQGLDEMLDGQRAFEKLKTANRG